MQRIIIGERCYDRSIIYRIAYIDEHRMSGFTLGKKFFSRFEYSIGKGDESTFIGYFQTVDISDFACVKDT